MDIDELRELLNQIPDERWVQHHSDSGDFSCFITNEHGNKSGKQKVRFYVAEGQGTPWGKLLEATLPTLRQHIRQGEALREIEKISDEMVANETYIGAESINKIARRAQEEE